jgi:hypothetical protein
VDFFGGAFLGGFLGLLIGLSTTPVVSVVISGLVALLAAFFGLAEKLGAATSASGTPRLMGFALFAAVFTLVGVGLRTYEVLIPSIASQKADLKAMGYADGSKEQTEMLAYLRYGLLPTGVTATKDRSPGGGVVYARPPSSVCADISKAGSNSEVMEILGKADNRLKGVADKFKNFSADRQGDAADVAKSILCPGN